MAALDPDAKTFDFLTGAEGDYMGVITSQLADVPWAKPLISDIEADGGLKGGNKAKLFELRFGHELHGAGIQPQYRVPGDSGEPPIRAVSARSGGAPSSIARHVSILNTDELLDDLPPERTCDLLRLSRVLSL